MYAPLHHRRAALIQERLPHVSAKPIVFPAAAPTAPLGSWTLLAPDRLLAAARCSSPFPNGEVQFIEDKTGPPNRAYLKLWEALVRLRRWPQPGERCLDLGASPGGWTWVLAKLGASVMAIDKAPLDPRIAAMPGVEWRGESAFALEPESVGPVDWLFSDIICLSGATAAAGRALAGVGAGEELRLHDQVPGRDRSRRRRCVRRDPRRAGPAPAPQQARADVHATRLMTPRAMAPVAGSVATCARKPSMNWRARTDVRWAAE